MSFWLSLPSSLVRPDLVGDPRPQDLRLTQRGVRRRLNEDLLTAPHDVLVLDPIIVHADLAPADAGPRAGDAAVEGRHVAHALLGTHLPHCPVVRAATDRVEADKAHTLVIESPVGLAEELPPLLSHVQIPVVLARDEDLPNLY